MDRLFQDLRYTVRALARRPALTALVLLTFGLGIGASTAMYSVVDAVLMRPLTYPAPEKLVSLYAYTQRPDQRIPDEAQRGPLSDPEFRALRETSRGLLDGLAALRLDEAILYGRGEPERIPLGLTTPDLFGRVLQVSPMHGRVFEERDADARTVVLLTEGFWRRRFGADPGIVSSTIRLGDDALVVIGILPERAQLSGWRVDAWRLMPLSENWNNHWLSALARVSDGVTLEQAGPRLSTMLSNAVPEDHHRHGVNIFQRQNDETRGVIGPLWLLTLASLLLLIVACGNVAGLLVGAAIDRERELAIRTALGAERRRLVRQLLTESTLLGAGAAAVGILVAMAATRAFVLLAPDGVPRIDEAAIDTKALAFAIGLALVCGLLCGLLPAIHFSRTDLRSSMTATSRGSTGDRAGIQGVVVVGELALATLLLVGAGLLTRTVLALNRVDPGFAANETIALELSGTVARLAPNATDERAIEAAFQALQASLSEQLGALPGVRGVALTSNLPLSPSRSSTDVRAQGQTESTEAEWRFVTPNYFQVMGVRLLQGRTFTPEEDRSDAAPAVLVSEGLARRAWPGESAIGKRLQYWNRSATVIGVVADIRDEALQTATAFAFYAPDRQSPVPGTFVLRATGDPVDLIPAIRDRVRQINPGIAIMAVHPLSDLVTDQSAAQRYRARLTIVFSLLATLFSIMGIYAVTARSVAARTRELGIRMALGARPKGILGLVIRQALRLAAMGGALGIALSLIATRSVETYLWGVQRTDLLTLIVIALLLGTASVLAALPPGLRAARVDPMEALRAE